MENKTLAKTLVVLLLIVLTAFLVQSLVNEVVYNPGSGRIGIHPESGEVTGTEQFDVTVKMNIPEGQTTNSVEFFIDYDETQLEVIQVTDSLSWQSFFRQFAPEDSDAGRYHFLDSSLDDLAAGEHNIATITFRVKDQVVGTELALDLSEATVLNDRNDNIILADGEVIFTVIGDFCTLGDEQINIGQWSEVDVWKLCNNNVQLEDKCQGPDNRAGTDDDRCPDNQVCQRDGTCREPVELGCDSIIRENTQLESDILGCSANGLTIGANNVVLDCDGHTISGSQLHAGITVNRKSNVKIRNCNIENFNRGVSVEHSSHIIIENSHIKNNNNFGIYLGSSTVSTLENNEISENDHGIYLESASDGNTLQRNKITDNKYNGVFVESSLSNNIRENTVDGTGEGVRGINIRTSNGNVIEDNTVENFDINGISLVQSDSNRVESNIVRKNGKSAPENFISAGIHVHASSGNELVDNRVDDNEFGIYLLGGGENTLEDNTVNGNVNDGIVLDSSDSNQVDHNIACDNRNIDFLCEQSSGNAGGDNRFGESVDGVSTKVTSCGNWPSYSINPAESMYVHCQLRSADEDLDGIRDEVDNCHPQVCQDNNENVFACANPLQDDVDGDGKGDNAVCDPDLDNDSDPDNPLPDSGEPEACRDTPDGPGKYAQGLIHVGIFTGTGQDLTGCLVGDIAGSAGDDPDGCVNDIDLQYLRENGADVLDRLSPGEGVSATGIQQLTTFLFKLHKNYDPSCTVE